MSEPTIVDIHITGRSSEPATFEALMSTLRNCVLRFNVTFNRMPTAEEYDVLAAGVQRYHGIPEHCIEPESQRRQLQ
jgi:hypothetical protein